jgi:iron complex outermembrane recepter protein
MAHARTATWLAAMALWLPQTAWAGPKDDARRHFAAGLQAAQEGQYQIALQRFLAAQEAYPHPSTLYNIARSYYDARDLPNALTYYRLFRDSAPDKAGDVDPVIAALESQLDTRTAGPAQTDPGTAFVTGPSREELARLRAIADELAALSSAFADRAEEDLATAAPEPGEEPTEPVAVVDESEFLSDAYERIVVTASRVGQDPLDSPSTVTVLTSDDIRLSGATDVTDLLRRVAGVDAMALAGSLSEISIRGFSRRLGNKVLVLVDGRSTYMDFVGVTFWPALPIAMAEIDRIEVIRGPGSAVYGANAVTGVINIITRTPGDEPGGLVEVRGGHPGIAQGTVVASGRNASTAWRFSAGYQQHGRWAKEYELNDAEGELREDSPVVPFFEDQDTALRTVRANGRMDWTFGTKGFASLTTGFSNGDFEYYNLGALPNYGMELGHHYVRGDIAYDRLHIRSFWNHDRGDTAPWLDYDGLARPYDGRFVNDAVDFEVESPLEFDTGSMAHTLNLGVGYRYKQIAFGYLAGGFENPYNEHHFAAFVNEQATIGKLGIVGSLRLDRHPLIPLGRTLSPRAALLYRVLDSTSIRATAGTAFRAPNSLESYMDFNLNTTADGAYIQDFGDQINLLPERITTFELGIHDESSYLHQADLVLYYNAVSDLISLRSVTPTVAPFDASSNGFKAGETGWFNAEERYTGLGMEAEAEVYPTDGLDLFTNVELTRINEFNPRTEETVRDGSSSGLQINAGGSYRTPFRTDLSLAAHYTGKQNWRLREFDASGTILIVEREIPARVLMSARIGARPLPSEELEVALNLWNFTELFGDGYLEHPVGQPVTGRIFGSVAYRF